MNRARRQPKRVRIALLGILVIALGIYLVFTKRIPFLHGYRLHANFESSNQLVPGFSPVRLAGVTVGKVIKVENGPGDLTKVTMELKDDALPIHEDARLRIRPRLFLEGGFAVELRPGSPSAPELDDGATLPADQTAAPVQFHQILSAFDLNTRSDFQDLLKEFDIGLDKGGARALGQSFKPFAPVLRDTAQIAQAARGPLVHDASEGIAAASKVTQALADHEGNLRELITSLNTTMTALASRDVQLAATVREFDLTVRDAPDQLDRIDATLPTVNRFVREIRPTLRALPPVLDHTAPVLDQLRGLVGPAELPGLVTDLTPVVNNLGPLTMRLNRLFPLITPVTDCVRDRVLPVLNSIVPDGELSTDRPAWQDLAHSFVGLSSAAQNFDGNGFSVRYLAGAGETSIGTGAVPGLGTLAGMSTEPILGSRPRWLGPGALPQFNASEECRDQDPVDLTQRTQGGGPLPARTATIPNTGVTDLAGLQQATRQYLKGVDRMEP
jgi:virulence factor Mce-like protein